MRLLVCLLLCFCSTLFGIQVPDDAQRIEQDTTIVASDEKLVIMHGHSVSVIGSRNEIYVTATGHLYSLHGSSNTVWFEPGATLGSVVGAFNTYNYDQDFENIPFSGSGGNPALLNVDWIYVKQWPFVYIPGSGWYWAYYENQWWYSFEEDDWTQLDSTD